MGKPHALHGEVYVVRISDDPRRFDVGARLTHEDGRVLVVESAREHRDRLLVKFEGIDDRTAAERLKGTLYVGSDSVRALEDDEYWPHELEGAAVVSSAGEELGVVTKVLVGGMQDMLEIDTTRGARLVPLVKAIVKEVDVAAARIVIDPPEGLLE